MLQQFAFALSVHGRFLIDKVARPTIARELFLQSLTQISRPGDSKNLFVSIKKLENAFDRGHGCHMLLIEIQPRFRCFNDQVIVIVHRAISMANPVKTLDDLCKRIEEEFESPSFLKIAFGHFRAT